MPGSHGLVGLASLRAEHPGVAVVMISAHDDPRDDPARADLWRHRLPDQARRPDALQAGLRAVLACEEWLPPTLRDAVARAHASAQDRELAAQAGRAEPATVQGADAGRRRPAEQADRRRTRHPGAHGQGAHERDLRKARRQQPHPGRRPAAFAGTVRSEPLRSNGLAADRLTRVVTVARAARKRAITDFSASGLSGLYSSGSRRSSTAMRTSSLWSAVMITQGRSGIGRQQAFAQHEAGLVRRRGGSRAAACPACALATRRSRLVGIARGQHFALPARQQRLHRAQHLEVVVHHQHAAARQRP